MMPQWGWERSITSIFPLSVACMRKDWPHQTPSTRRPSAMSYHVGTFLLSRVLLCPSLLSLWHFELYRSQKALPGLLRLWIPAVPYLGNTGCHLRVVCCPKELLYNRSPHLFGNVAWNFVLISISLSDTPQLRYCSQKDYCWLFQLVQNLTESSCCTPK